MSFSHSLFLTSQQMENTKSLYAVLDRCQYILANTIESTLDENFPMYEAMSEWNYEWHMNELMKWHDGNWNLDNQKEFDKFVSEHGEKPLGDVIHEMSDELQDEVQNAVQESDYPEIYQTFIVDEGTFETLKDYGQFVYYNEDLDLHFWGVMHYGTAWSHVMGSVYPVQNAGRYTK